MSSPHPCYGVVPPPTALASKHIENLQTFHPLLAESLSIKNACAAHEGLIGEERLH